VIARLALAVLLAIAILAQPLSAVVAQPVLEHLNSGTDTWTIWTQYNSSPAPDVLFVGDSRVRQDVDVTAVSRDLVSQSSRTATVSKIGLSSADMGILDAVLYRVMARSSRPRTVVIALSEFAFNARYQPDRTADYWELTFPPDLGFMRVALAHDANPSRLLSGWALPLVAHAPILAQGAQCLVHSSPVCVPPMHLHDGQMTTTVRDTILAYYVDLFLRDFKWSEGELQDLSSAAERVRAAGSHLAFVVLPINGIAEINPTLYADFLAHIGTIADARRAPLTDLHAGVSESDWSVWLDPSHLNDRGARLIAPQLASIALDAT
jgi:hypothetical protein